MRAELATSMRDGQVDRKRGQMSSQGTGAFWGILGHRRASVSLPMRRASIGIRINDKAVHRRSRAVAYANRSADPQL
jgi:hypothetical protein